MHRCVALSAIALAAMLPACSLLPNKQAEAEKMARQRFDHQKAKMKYLLALEQYEHGQIANARRSIREAIALHTDDPGYYLLLARICIEEGELTQAAEALTHIEGQGPLTAEGHHVAGLLAERYGRLENALEHYAQAHQLDPHRIDYLMTHAEILVSLQRPEEAVKWIDERIEDFDGDGRLHALRAEALVMLERYAEAAVSCRLAMTRFPNDHHVAELHALCLYWSGRHTEAAAALAALLDRTGYTAPQPVTRALIDSLVESGGAAAARDQAEKLTRVRPEDPASWLLLAQSEIALEHLPSAQRAASSAVRVAPNNAVAWALLGFIELQMEHWNAARRALQKSLELDPSDGTTLCLMGQLHEFGGSLDEARRFYTGALALNPQDALALELLNELPAAEAGVEAAQQAPPPPDESDALPSRGQP